MSQYKNNPKDFLILRKRILSRSIPVVFISSLAGIIIFYFSADSRSADILVWVIIIIFFLVIMTYSILKAIKRQKEMYDSYLLEINNEQLSRYQIGLPNASIAFNEITEIKEDKNGDLIIKGQNSQIQIAISSFLQNYTDVKDLLQAQKAINQIQTKNLFQKYPFVSGVIPGALMIAVYISNNKLVVSASGSAVIILMLWGFYNVRTSKLVDDKIKRNAWFMLIVIFSVVSIIYKKLIAN